MAVRKRVSVRPADKSSIADKKFRRLLDLEKKLSIDPTSLQVVEFDLRNGSLASLERYLAMYDGALDPRIVRAIQLLISGSVADTKYRLVLVDHPDLPKRTGGRPNDRGRAPTARELEIAQAFRDLAKPGEIEAAATELAQKYGTAISTVYKYVRRVANFELSLLRQAQAADRTRAIVAQAEKALKMLRRARKS